MNGQFDDGLNQWTTVGDVRALPGEAGLGDDGASQSALYQGVMAVPASFILQFDFLNNLSADVPLGSFPDSFFASIYFINDLSGLDPQGSGFDDVLELMDLDVNGPDNVNGSLSSSPKGGQWTRFSSSFTNNYTYIVPTFEFFDLNSQANDSLVQVDNVVLIIPEPPAWQLALAGLLSLWGLRALRRRA